MTREHVAARVTREHVARRHNADPCNEERTDPQARGREPRHYARTSAEKYPRLGKSSAAWGKSASHVAMK